MPTESNITISDIRQLGEGERFKAVFAVAGSRKREDKNKRPFWEISVIDSEGALEAKVWSDGKWWDLRGGERIPVDPVALDLPDDLSNQPIGVRGYVSVFKGKQQFQFSEIYFLDEKTHPLSSFLQRSPVPLKDMEKEFGELTASCGEPLAGFLQKVFSGDLWEEFRDAPAAVSHHHAYVHGLLEHTLSVTRSARAMALAYAQNYPDIRPDIATAGALLHDLGKLEAYRLDPFPGMTVEGTVIDHIALGYARFQNLAGEHGLDQDLAVALGHIIISHHGRKEYGSPVLPATPEALIVSSADELDFMMYCWNAAPESMNGVKGISDYHPSAQRRFWKPAQAAVGYSEG